MTHLPYIAGAYGLFALVASWLGLDARLRLHRTERRLRAVDPRARERATDFRAQDRAQDRA